MLCCGVWALVFGGCGPQAGALWYHLGLVPRQKVEAKYTLTKGPLLILVEGGSDELVATPRLRSLLVNELTKQFAQHRVNRNVIPQAEIDRLRRTQPRFDQIATNRVGKKLGAEQVLWLTIEEFAVETTPEDPTKAASLVLSARVINAQASRREDVRLWPAPGDWQTVSVTKTMHFMQKVEGQEELIRVLAAEMAERVAKLFHDYEIAPE